ncbi:peptide deformylase [Candidatus Vallotia tarda]|uniref:Peptide deformylase n=1 Tax=Candidatus Vallotiella hemipterorum TaxID=1177213 RepID=A0A916NUC3_9BURK|nr:peptide deformylase [Candidatus Vallotia tarda]CAG7595069.1 Peptide deformylase 1 [Candidatus Vallotia tarda]
MAVLRILHYPDKRLHRVAKLVRHIDRRIRKLVADMAETMYLASGVGLAATQVNIHERVIVVDVSNTHNALRVFINPDIIWLSKARTVNEEGCLSLPGIYEGVERANQICVQALNEHGEKFKLECEGFLAICIQHEIDHLFGKVFIEHLSLLKQMQLKTKMKKSD